MPSITIDLLDKVADILNTEVNGNDDYIVSRMIIPRSQKQKRTKPLIFVSIGDMSSVEQSRGDLYVNYGVSVGLVYDAPKETQQEAALAVVEDIIFTLESAEYRSFTSDSGLKFCYKPPFALEPVFDSDILNEQGTLISTILFNYCHLKDR